MKRLNVKLAVWLIGITLVSVVGVHFLHGYQIERNADFLKRQAETALKNGKTEDAIKYYSQFLKYRDEGESYSELARLVDEAANESDAKRRDWIRAYNVLEEAIRRHPDRNDIRRRLVEYTIQIRRIPDALGHIKQLEDPNNVDPSLELLKARCYLRSGEDQKAIKVLYSLVGYDELTKEFATEPGPGAKEVEAYELLAGALRLKVDNAELADAVVDRMVEMNPDSAEAHLSRARWVAATTETSKAKSDLDQAYELAPEDPDVVLSMAAFAIEDKDFDRAQELLDKALESNPERQDVYVLLAQLASTNGNPQAGIEHLKAGIKKADQVQIILPMLLDLQLAAGELQGAHASCDEMEERDEFPAPFLRFSRARIQFAEKDYWGASRELEAVRPALARTVYAQKYSPLLESVLSGCYESLRLHDRQLEVSRRVLQSNAGQAGARLSEAFALQRLGRYDEALTSMDVILGNIEQYPELRLPLFQLLTTDQLRRPSEQRDWTLVEKVVQGLYDDPDRSEMDNAILRGELLLAQDQLDQALSVLNDARKIDPKDVRVWKSLVKLLQRMDRSERIGPLLDLAEKEVGDVYALRIERLRMLLEEDDETALAGLKKIEQDADQFSEEDRVALMTQLGGAYLRLKDYDSAKRCWRASVVGDPENAQIRQVLFELMSDTSDSDGMQEVMKGIHDSPNWGPQSPLYKYCKAMSLVRPLSLRSKDDTTKLTDADRKSLIDARRLIDEAIQVRSEWGVLWRVRGEIDQLEGDLNSAISSYQRALACSHTGQTVVARRLVRLLSATRRFSEADKVLQYVGQLSATDPLNKVIQRETLNQGDISEALAMAQKDVEQEPDNPANQIWLAHVLEQAGRVDEAEAGFRKAVEVGPNLPQAWLLLVQHLVSNRKTADAAEVIREATPKLKDNPVALAQLHQIVGDQDQAETFFKQAVRDNPGDVTYLRGIAEYYVKRARSGPAPQFQQELRKAAPYLEQIVAKNEGSNDPAAVRMRGWARRAQAEIIAAGGTYDDIVRATKLVEQNATSDGRLAPEDLQAIIDMLAGRPEPASRDKAIEMIVKLSEIPGRELQNRENLLLGQLYARRGDWDRAKQLMIGSLTQRRDDPNTLLPYVQLLTQHDETTEAARWLDTLEEVVSKLPPAERSKFRPAVIEARARLLVKQGMPDQAIDAVKQLVPSPIPPAQLYRLEQVAMLLEQLEQYDAAKQLLEEYLGQDPRGTIAMGAFLGRRGEVDRAFELLEESRSNQSVVEIMAVGLDTLRRHPDQATPERFKQLEGWAKAALSAEGDVQRIRLLMAELYDLQGRTDDVIRVYREILADKSTPPLQAAQTKNNLAFALAITKQDLPEALQLVNESIQVIGPQSALLDTRGVVQLNHGNVDEAVADLRVAAADNPTRAKYYHLALAEKAANNTDAAREAIRNAEDAGEDRTPMTPVEQQGYERLVNELK